jgi:transcriptional regulator with PAS, ATPase and Fis domain
MEGFATEIRALGRELAERGVPFAEVVASVHFLEESAATHFRVRRSVIARGPAIDLTFDKLSHCRIILLASTYYSERESAATLRLKSLEAEADRLAGGSPARRARFHGLVGASPCMQRLYEQIAASAAGHGAVLIEGESGTGKEVVARALHERAGLPDRPFVAVNCAALSRELVESELFGHGKGAYTGAHGEYAGLIRSAAGGTVFLDEITEMATAMQAKLLRVLEERTVRPVGTARELKVGARFIASTNRDPEFAVEAGLLRRDLYYRLNVHRIAVPPLRERIEDVRDLVLHFAELLASRGLRRVEGVEVDALAVLEGYAWPGNVRELRNAIEHALTAGKSKKILRENLPPHVIRGARPGAPRREVASPELKTLEESERDLIQRALEATRGNKLQAARLLRISRHRLYDRLRKYRLGS